ncbi:hypothetical protein GJ496_009048 [Pomphorhynchus laevis]|nr:hypothetical protein GJ496_009048 [Pomphorhynchus laevis]
MYRGRITNGCGPNALGAIGPLGDLDLTFTHESTQHPKQASNDATKKASTPDAINNAFITYSVFSSTFLVSVVFGPRTRYLSNCGIELSMRNNANIADITANKVLAAIAFDVLSRCEQIATKPVTRNKIPTQIPLPSVAHIE